MPRSPFLPAVPTDSELDAYCVERDAACRAVKLGTVSPNVRHVIGYADEKCNALEVVGGLVAEGPARLAYFLICVLVVPGAPANHPTYENPRSL